MGKFRGGPYRNGGGIMGVAGNKNRKWLLAAVLIGLALIVSFAAIGVATTQPSTGEVQAAFLAAASGHARGAITPPTISAVLTIPAPAELLVAVFAVSPIVAGGNVPHVLGVADGSRLNWVLVSSVVNTQSNAFAGGIDLEFWAAMTNTATTNDIIGGNLNDTGYGAIMVSLYEGVTGVGVTQTSQGVGTSTSFTITTTDSGSLIMGAFGVVNPGAITPGPGLVNLRAAGQQCNTSPPNCVSGRSTDTNQTFVNSYPFVFSGTFGSSAPFAAGAIELLPIVNEPNDQVNELSVCPLASPSPCLTKVQSGSLNCNVPANSIVCNVTVNFSPAYPLAPLVLETLTSNPILTNNLGPDVMIFNQEVNPTFGVEAFDASYQNADIVKTSSPMTLTMKGVSPAQAGEFAYLEIYVGTTQSGGWSGTPVSVTSVSDTQGAGWYQVEPFTIALGSIFFTAGVSVWAAILPTTAQDSVTVTVADSSSPFANDNIGSTLELFQNVGGVSSTSLANMNLATSDSISITPAKANDFLVGGVSLATYSQFLIGGVAACDTITLSAPTTTRQTDANCAANKVVNFASGDQHPSSTSSQTFAATFSDANSIGGDGDVIFVSDLLPRLSNANGVWNVGSSLGELFGSTDHEISYAIPPSAGGGALTRTTLHYTCTSQDNPASTVNLFLYGGATASSGTALVCNGQDQSAGSMTWTASSGTQLFKLEGQCVSPSGCSDDVILSSVYFAVNYSLNQLPTIRVSALSATSVTFQVLLLTSDQTPTNVAWNWISGTPS